MNLKIYLKVYTDTLDVFANLFKQKSGKAILIASRIYRIPVYHHKWHDTSLYRWDSDVLLAHTASEGCIALNILPANVLEQVINVRLYTVLTFQICDTLKLIQTMFAFFCVLSFLFEARNHLEESYSWVLVCLFFVWSVPLVVKHKLMYSYIIEYC